MPTTASTIHRLPYVAITRPNPGDRQVLSENEFAQRWGSAPKRSSVGAPKVAVPAA